METVKKAAQKEVHTVISEKIIEHLQKGIVPWRTSWMEAGVPTSLISKRPFRGINVLLLAALGYERNLFLTLKQLETAGGSLKPNEEPHTIVFWANQQPDATSEASSDKKPGKLKTYMVYDIAQCTGIPEDLIPEHILEADPIKACEKIVGNLSNGPAMRYKEPGAFYDPLEDNINMPKLKSFANPACYYSALFHQLAHSTGHHTRLNRMGLVQMSEHGCDCHTLEELVTEIVTNYIENYAGIPYPFEPTEEYISGWIQKFKGDHYLIFTACTLAQRAIDFILNIKDVKDDAAQ